ncbi:MAG: WYL domain-containing protein [Chloroflexi bacterium]|nr:WYL domain-containing protein [Chloroflexota bacterium]
MRADRLLSILLLLQVNRKLTAAHLARRLEVSPRTIHRDMEALSMAGVPIYAERGGGGGWVLPASFRTEVIGLTDAEVQALFLPVPTRLLADLGLARAADGAQVKMLASLSPVARRDAEFVRQRIHVDGAGWHDAATHAPAPALAALQEALWLEQRVRITYERAPGHTAGPAGERPTVERELDPLGLVAKGRTWYLVAGVGDDRRTYRVSRIQAVEILAESAVRPADFDLAAAWADSSAAFVAALPRYHATVRVAPDALPWVWMPGSFVQVVSQSEPDADGWRTLQLELQTPENACRYVLGFGAQMAVVGPPELRAAVIEAAHEIVRSYAE